MKIIARFCAALVTLALLGASTHSSTVSVDPNTIGQAPVTSWPTFNGDYSGARYSTLTQIRPANLKRLETQWVYRIKEVGAQRGAPVPIIKCTPLLVNGVLYLTIPDHLWALDARSGKELWHYDWVDHGGHLVGQRGVGIWKTTVFFQTPDNWLIALDCEYRQGTVEEELRGRAQTILLHLGAADREEPCDRRRRRGRHGHAGFSRLV